MYTYDENRPILPEEFTLPFAGSLNRENRWCQLAMMIPWKAIESHYVKKLGKIDEGRRAFSVRVAFGSLLIQTKKKTTDEETVLEIMESPYLQYFLGFHSFRDRKPFNSSLMTYFRKRIDAQMINEINEIIAVEQARQLALKELEKESKSDDDSDSDGPGGSSCSDDRPEQLTEQVELDFSEPQIEPQNHGTLLLDATCVPVDISFPTDLRLLNRVREITEEVIDCLHQPHIGHSPKPRTYRRTARREFLRIEKNRKKNRKLRRKAIRKQLSYVGRNLRTIETMISQTPLTMVPPRLYRRLLVAGEVYRQQDTMYRENTNRVDDRIVSIHQPWVRPIIRGKARAGTEFGPKLAISVVNGFSFMEKLDYNSFNEGNTLIDSAWKYHRRFGFFPKSIIADQIYRNRENIRFCKTHGIRLSGRPLGRPSQDPEVLRQQKHDEKNDAGIRNAVEGVFGTAKRKLGLNLLMTRLPETGETVVAMHLVAMNLDRMLRILLRQIWSLIFDSEYCSERARILV